MYGQKIPGLVDAGVVSVFCSASWTNMRLGIKHGEVAIMYSPA
jgi:hypothetical protein